MADGDKRMEGDDARRTLEREIGGHRVARLGDFGDYRVADGEPDPRGWHVLTCESARPGEVMALVVDLDTMAVRYLEVELDKDALHLRATRKVLVPTEAAWLNEDEEIVRLAVTTAQLVAVPEYDVRALSRSDEDALHRRYARYQRRSTVEPGRAGRRRMSGQVERCQSADD